MLEFDRDERKLLGRMDVSAGAQRDRRAATAIGPMMIGALRTVPSRTVASLLPVIRVVSSANVCVPCSRSHYRHRSSKPR
jgi:hypothetical protein